MVLLFACSKATAFGDRGRHHARRTPCGLGVQDNTLRVWDLESGQSAPHARRPQQLGERGRHHAGRTPCGLGVRGQHAAGLGPGERPKRPHARRPQRFGDGVAITPDGRRAVSASWDNTLRVWDLESGQSVRTLEGHSSGSTGSPSRPTDAVRSRRPRTTRCGFGTWRAAKASARSKATAVGERGRHHARRTPCGLGVRDNTLRVWDLESGQSVRTLEGHSGSVSGVAITPDGRRAVSASGTKRCGFGTWRAAKVVRTLEGHSNCGERGRHHARRTPCGLGVRGQNAAGLGPGERPKLRTLEGHSEFGERGRHHARRTPCGLGVRGQNAAGLGPGERPKRSARSKATAVG